MKYLTFAAILLITSTSILHGANSDSIPSSGTIRRIFPTEYALPASNPIVWKDSGIVVHLHARAFSQGNIVYLEIVPDDKSEIYTTSINCRYEQNDVLLTRFTWGYRGFFALPPDAPPGEKTLTIEYQGLEQPSRHVLTFNVVKTDFPVYRRSMNVGKFSDINHARAPEIQTFIEYCSNRKKEAFSHQGEDLLSSVLAHPRDRHYVTSPFWSTRIYERYKIKNGKKIAQPSESKYHRGIDFRGSRGDPVYALADGRVVLAEKLYYEGNFTVIDHGNRIISHYMHQDTILVKEGQLVRGGDKIGTVGSTGVSTGPHLHVSLVVNGIQVDPLSILALPVRN